MHFFFKEWKKTRNKAIQNETERKANIFDGMKVIKSFDEGVSYKLVKGDVDYTPLPIKDRTFLKTKIYIEMEDFVVLFRTENYIPTRFPLIHSYPEVGEEIDLVPLEKIMRLNEEEELQLDILDRITRTILPQEEEHVDLEIYKILLQETETIELCSYDSIFYDLQSEPSEISYPEEEESLPTTSVWAQKSDGPNVEPSKSLFIERSSRSGSILEIDKKTFPSSNEVKQRTEDSVNVSDKTNPSNSQSVIPATEKNKSSPANKDENKRASIPGPSQSYTSKRTASEGAKRIGFKKSLASEEDKKTLLTPSKQADPSKNQNKTLFVSSKEEEKSSLPDSQIDHEDASFAATKEYIKTSPPASEVTEASRINQKDLSNAPLEEKSTLLAASRKIQDSPSANESGNLDRTPLLDLDIEIELKSPFQFIDNSTFTQAGVFKNVGVNTKLLEVEHKSVSVSESIISDCYKESELEQNKEIKSEHDPCHHYPDYENVSSSILDSPIFDYVFHLVERIVDHYYYHKEQMILRYLQHDDDVSLNHSLSCLFSLKLPLDLCKNKVLEVTSLSWHPLNRNLLGIAYGTMHIEKQSKGMVCLWNLKNPSLPERVYKFKKTVTCIAFCELYPYAMLISFCDGNVAIINISIKKLVIISNTFNSNTEYLPITHLSWFKDGYDNYYPVTSSKSGDIYRYKIENDFIPVLLLDLPPKYDLIKYTKRKKKNIYPRKFGISTFIQHPTNFYTYLIGTDDGYVHICCTLYKWQDIDYFSAHEGPICSIEFHPISDKLFLTCGNDFYVKVWGYGISEPLMSFTARKELVCYAKWFPHNPMLFISMSEKYIDVWDFRRLNDVIPVFTYENPDHSSYLIFNTSPFDWIITVGDVDGYVHVLKLNEITSDLIFSPYLLARSLKNHIKPRNPLLWKQVEIHFPEFKVDVPEEDLFE